MDERIRVLVVDDAPDLRRVVRQTLERHGGFVVVGEAGDGEEAVRVAPAADPDIVLLDLDMPGVGGVDALPMLREAGPRAQGVIPSGPPRRRLARLRANAGAGAQP